MLGAIMHPETKEGGAMFRAASFLDL